jgi:alpha-galactosidase
MNTCLARLTEDILVLENNLLRREFRWNGGNLISRCIEDKAGGHRWEMDNPGPDVVFPGEEGTARDGQLEVKEILAASHRPAFLQAGVTFKINDLEIKRQFRIYPDCPAVACDFYLRGKSTGPWRQNAMPGFIMVFEDTKGIGPVIERFGIYPRHVELSCIRFEDMTDRNNNLVHRQDFTPFFQLSYHAGNLILGRDRLAGKGFFILKEAPCSGIQLAYPGFDFVCNRREVQAVGVGLDAHELDPDRWRRCYGVVTGVAGGREEEVLAALRNYQGNIRTRRADRDEMILVNTWGDRAQDENIGESFALAELEAGQKLGVTHFQLDDGWQQGQTPNSAKAGGTFAKIWEREDYWQVHSGRFPRGLEPVMAKAKDVGIEVGLWFNPCPDDHYKHWQKDADLLISMNRRYGIRTFKIDGVQIFDKQTDENLRNLLDRVLAATNGEAVFNLDETAGRRFGYHYFNEYGVFFLENRYTDWGNYYPHWTLRNLWQLSRYVPAQNLQIEFLNLWRNRDKYPKEDPLAPKNVPFEYCFAITMPAQPLAWFEASNLPEEGIKLGRTIREYRKFQEQIHAGQIFPIGEKPNGTAWTGFQSCQKDHGFLIVYREFNRRDCAAMKLWNLADKTLKCRRILGSGEDFTQKTDDDGRILFSLPHPMTFALYEYWI